MRILRYKDNKKSVHTRKYVDILFSKNHEIKTCIHEFCLS